MDSNGVSAAPRLAIVGMACRFPGASDLAAFWHNLASGTESIRRLDEATLRARGVSDARLADPNYVPVASDIDDLERFDTELFGFTPREAEITDPQHRLLLVCAHEALEDAACAPQGADGRVGVFCGVGMNHYLLRHLWPHRRLLDDLGGHPLMIGNDKSFAATLISYKLGLTGPSLQVDTSCSTGLVAVHQAAKSLLTYDCDVALAGAASVAHRRGLGYTYDPGGIFSPDGHCRSYDARGQGTVFGSGAGMVVLKRFEDAVADGNSIRAVLLASAINNDGADKVGFTAPSLGGQAAVITEALEIAEVAADSVSYVEGHGTATPLGDPIEVAALTRAFRRSTERRRFCALGSVKSNVGHLDTAAGIAGLIKTVLALEHQFIPPTLHFETPNPRLELDSSPFFVNRESLDWSHGATPRRAGVSSFGIGGTNAHVVLEEAPAPPATTIESPGPWLLRLSAHTPIALDTLTQRLADRLGTDPESSLADVEHTLTIGRRERPHRRILVTGGRDHAVTALRQSEGIESGHPDEEAPQRIFLFPGQGAQRPGMGAGLYHHSRMRVFRQEIDRCAEALRLELDGLVGDHAGDLRELLFADPDDSRAAEVLRQTQVTQPALFAVSYALARQWQAWGVEPDGMLGHSLGEYVAACLAGVFELDDALGLVAARGRLMQALPAGGMLSVHLAEDALGPWLGDGLTLAAVNAPELCTLSGPQGNIDACARDLERQGIVHRRLHTSHAFHSAMMEPMLDAFADELEQRPRKHPEKPFVSNLSGRLADPDEVVTTDYWLRHLRSPVRFADGIATLARDVSAVFLEVGPGNALGALVRRHPEAKGCRPLASLGSPRDERPEPEKLLTAFGRLWLTGVRDRPESAEGRRRLHLPPTPVLGERHWIDDGVESTTRTAVIPSRAEPAAGVPEARRADPESWLWQQVWQTVEPPAASRKTASPDEAVLLIESVPTFGPSSNDSQESGPAEMVDHLAKGLGRVLGERGVVVRVRPGESFARHDATTFEVRLGVLDDLSRLLSDLRTSGQRVTRVVHTGLVTGMAPAATAETLAPTLEGFHDLTTLARALATSVSEPDATSQILLTVVADRVFDASAEAPGTSPSSSILPEKSLALGACRVLAEELPMLRCAVVDPGMVLHDNAVEAADAVLTELTAGLPAPEVAWREGRRLVPEIEPLSEAQSLTPIPSGRIALITGGLGGLGSSLAEELVSLGFDRLALVGRRTLPEPNRWDDVVAEAGPEDPTRRAIERVRHLETGGAEVLHLVADVTDREALNTALENVEQRWGDSPAVVVHAAGVAGGGLLRTRSREQAEAVLAPKVHGTLVLAECLASRLPVRLVLCSSLTAVTGGLGQLDYCAANAFLDALGRAHRNDGLGLTVSAIGWDVWRQVGMAIETPVPDALRGHREATLRQGILPVEGRRLFARLLRDPRPHVLVSTTDLRQRLEEGEGWPRRPDSTTSVDGRGERSATQIEDVLTEIWQRLLGVDGIGPDTNFFELGGDSLLLIQAQRQIRERLGVEVEAVDLFRAPTLRSLARHLSSTGPVARGPSTALSTGRNRQDSRIAIVGMAARFPGAPDVETFWDRLAEGYCAVRHPSDEALLAAGVSPEQLAHPSYVRATIPLDDIDRFDAEFFGLTPREAALTDPQQRLLLECCHHALEDAGVAAGEGGPRIGVWVGVALSGYLLRNLPDPGADSSAAALRTLIGNDKDFAATQISYRLDLKGPSINVNTACSTSLVAIDRARRSLLDGECDVALAGGSRIAIPHGVGYLCEDGGIHSPDGYCRAFAADAAGTIFGSGGGVVVLKRLAEAQADGDRIRAVILGSAVNNDGALKVGYTAPGVEGQAEVIAAAQSEAGVSPGSVSYVETHGTGTALGDPIEIEALREVFGDSAERCSIGSVKSNLGHLDTAAGVASLIKTVLALERRQLPPSLHCESPNPRIPFGDGPFTVQTELTDWDVDAGPRRAGVSSFGVGGTNAHLVLEEAPPDLGPPIATSPVGTGHDDAGDGHLLVLSARTPAALTELARRTSELLEHDDIALADLCRAAIRRRRHHPLRVAVWGDDRRAMGAELVRRAEVLAKGKLDDSSRGNGEAGGPLWRQARAFERGEALAPEHVSDISPGPWVPLPRYPFERPRHWIERKQNGHDPVGQALPGRRLKLPFSKELRFESTIGVDVPSLLDDHRLFGIPVVPGAYHLAEVLAAANTVFEGQGLVVEDLLFPSALVLPEMGRRTLQVVLTPRDDVAYELRVLSLADDADPERDTSWTLHAQGRLRPGADASIDFPIDASIDASVDVPIDAPQDLDRLRQHGSDAAEGATFYRAFRDLGYDLGPAFQWLGRGWRDGARALREMRRPTAVSDDAIPLHPGLIDACFQTLIDCARGAEAQNGDEADGDDLYVPFAIERFELYSGTHGSSDILWCQAEIEASTKGSSEPRGAMRLVDGSGRVIAALHGMAGRRISRRRIAEALGNTGALHELLYDVRWQPLDSPAESSSGNGEAAGWLVIEAGPERPQSSPGPTMADRLAETLRRRGDRCWLVTFREVASDARDCWQSRFDSAEEGRRLLDTIAQQDTPCSGIVCLAGAWSDRFDGTTEAEPFDPVGCATVLHLTQTLSTMAWNPPSLYLVSRGAVHVATQPRPLDLGQAPFWGLGGTLANEHPEWRCRRIDLDPLAHPATAVAGLVAELDVRPTEARGFTEDRLALRGKARLEARLRRLPGGSGTPTAAGRDFEPPAVGGFRMGLTEYGQLGHLVARPLVPRPPEAGEVRLRIHTAGLNFKDVMHALGLLRHDSQRHGLDQADSMRFGLEGSGVVEAVGEGVTHLQPGDEVVAETFGSLANTVTTDATLVLPRPPGLDVDEAATLPTVFLTAWYSLHDLANLQPGDRVLVHAAAGGVGQAAIQLARRTGAEIFATASPGKWDFLRQQGIQHLYDSRTPDFATSILEQTGERGVDVVLNSLKGEAVDQSFAALAQGGRFVELGKVEIWSAEQVAEHRPDASYWAFDLGEALLGKPERFAAILEQVLSEVEAGSLRPLPTRVYPLRRVGDAFRDLARGHNLGKLAVAIDSQPTLRIRADRSYLVSGGLGALGLEVAAWLVERGARHLVLLGRSAPNDHAKTALAGWREAGVTVRVEAADVADPLALERALSDLQPSPAGVVHAAGVLDDGILRHQSWERFERVLAPKVGGAWWLHRQSLAWDLDFFVLFSSTAALLGAPGQGSYASANAFLDTLAHHRRALGLPAHSVAWGPWAELGMAARQSSEARRRRRALGLEDLAPEQGLAVLEHLLQHHDPPAHVAAVDIAWPTLLGAVTNGTASSRDAGGVPPFFYAFGDSSPTPTTPSGPAPLADELAKVHAEDRPTFLLQALRERLATALGLSSPNEISPRQRLFDLGLDSLLAIELKNRLQEDLGRPLRTTLFFDFPTLEALVAHLLEDDPRPDTPGSREPGADEVAASPAQIPSDDDLEALEEADLARLLASKLESLQQENERR